MEHSKIKNFRVFLFTTQKNNQNMGIADRYNERECNVDTKIRND